MFRGDDIVEVADDHIGEDYVLGAIAPLANSRWRGPWDCAEFASWCAYQAYGVIFAVRPADPRRGESYSGWWYEDAVAGKHDIPVERALATRGAILVRRPRMEGGRRRIGHVAISLGDGSTIEAKDRQTGVAIVTGAAARLWHIGVLLPGVDYGGPSAPVAYAPPAQVLSLQSPYRHGPEVAAVQRALEAAGVDPGGRDGYFGPLTEAAVASFQILNGLVPDGVVGRDTAIALGLGWPIAPSQDDINAANRSRDRRFVPSARGPAREIPPAEARPPNADPGAAGRGAPLSFSFEKSGRDYTAVPSEGERFVVGTRVPYRDDMDRVGLHQRSAEVHRIDFAGVYRPEDWAGSDRIGPWAWFLWPTIMGESSGRFGRLNSYDRAGFTFGVYQFAAHTPEANLVLLFRDLLGLEDAERYFPDLALRANAQGTPTVHRLVNGAAVDLEVAQMVTRPNGKRERQIPDFMRYLNADPTKVDDAELTAAARLMLWCAEDAAPRSAQIRRAHLTARGKIRHAVAKVPALERVRDWRVFVWVNDILHQGRGKYAAIAAAVSGDDPLRDLTAIGARDYAGRIKTVQSCIAEVERGGHLRGWTPLDEEALVADAPAASETV